MTAKRNFIEHNLGKATIPMAASRPYALDSAWVSVLMKSTHLDGGSPLINYFCLAVPVLREEDEQTISKLLPVDLYIERKKLRVLPHFMKLDSSGDGMGSICRIRGGSPG